MLNGPMLVNLMGSGEVHGSLCSVVSVRWRLGDKLHYFGSVKSIRNSIPIPYSSEFSYSNKDDTWV